jgi:hypothetical protein
VSPRDGACVFRPDPLRSFCQEVFVACGMAREDAFIVADGLHAVRPEGVDSHSVASNRDPYRGGDGGKELREVGEDCGVEMGDFASRATGDVLH